jgi:RsmE family RNA methyltransferase
MDIMGRLPSGAVRIALDNYEGSMPLSQCEVAADPGSVPAVVLAVGPERGWSATERALLRGAGFFLAHLGSRVLRTETAVTAAVALLKAKRRLM